MKTVIWFVAGVLCSVAIYLSLEDKTTQWRIAMALLPIIASLVLYVFAVALNEKEDQ